MNDNVNNYVEKGIEYINLICKEKKKMEKTIGVLAFLTEAVILGVASLVYFRGLSAIGGYLTYATTVIIGAAMMHKESSDIRRYYEKEKKQLIELKERENMLFDEDYTAKTKAISKYESSIRVKERKFKSINDKTQMIRYGVVLSSILSISTPSFLWAPAALTALYAAIGIYKVKKNVEVAKEKFEKDSLIHDINVDNILRKDNGEEENENETVSELEGVKIDIILIPAKDLSDKERIAEQIVEDLANQPSGEDEKNKVNIKK